VNLRGAAGGEPGEIAAILNTSEVLFNAAKAGVRLVELTLLAGAQRLLVAADANAVPCPRDVAPTTWASALFRYRKRLWTLNPWKLVACKHLLHIHTMRKDKVRCVGVCCGCSGCCSHPPLGLDIFRRHRHSATVLGQVQRCDNCETLQ
jgi:hypothetical protein